MTPSGIHAILYAFFGPDGALDREAMRRQAEAVVAGGCHGAAVLGLATEVGKLSTAERRQVMEWAAEDLAGRIPLAVTVAEATVAGQREMVAAATALGADWVILQPPPVAGLPEIAYVRFFGKVAEAAALPVAIQNASQYIGIGLSTAGLIELNRQHPNVSILKGEGPALAIGELIEAAGDRFTVLNGRGGLELVDNLRLGCAGLVPAPECADVQARVHDAFAAGREDEAEALYRQILPLVVFVMQSVPHFLCYGKRILARRIGVAVHDRAPALTPTGAGLRLAARYADALPPLPLG